MDPDLRFDLESCETDIDGVLSRFVNNEELYVTCLGQFLADRTMDDLDKALASGAWDDAFTAAHALKGMAGNMGFIPLFHVSAKLVVLIRAGRTGEIAATCAELRRCYDKLTATIRRHCRVEKGL